MNACGYEPREVLINRANRPFLRLPNMATDLCYAEYLHLRVTAMFCFIGCSNDTRYLNGVTTLTVARELSHRGRNVLSGQK